MHLTLETPQQIKELCLRLLAQREHSQFELLQKMELKGITALQVQPVLDSLKAEGWQSDQRYAEAYARQRVLKGYGWQRVVYEIRQRGVGDVDFHALRQDLSVADSDSICFMYVKKYGESREITRPEWAKRVRFLLQRGFSMTAINGLFKQLQLTLT